MADVTFRDRVRGHDLLFGTFMKTPSVDILEVLMLAGLDFVCLDGEHAPFDRCALNACLAVARAAGFPVVVRVPSADAAEIGAALDLGATGIVVPHVTDPDTAARIARLSRFGHGGRGYAGSTRWAGFGSSSMPDLLARSQTETVVIAQIEDPEGVENCEAIARTDGIDAVFLGPADLSVAYGKSSQDSAELAAAQARVAKATTDAGKGVLTFTATAEAAQALRPLGYHGFFVASEHAWILQGARAVRAKLTG